MKLALIGTGKIIEDALFAMEPVETIERTAIFARPHSRDKAEKFAKQYAIKEVYTDYEELLEKTEADTVYIGLINSAHYPYAKQALLAGKNVILEKPFTGFYEETKDLEKIANDKKLFIFEAITVLHNEVFYEMKKNLNKLGGPQRSGPGQRPRHRGSSDIVWVKAQSSSGQAKVRARAASTSAFASDAG